MGIVTVQIDHCTRYSPALSLPPTCIEKKSCLEDLIKPGLVGRGCVGGGGVGYPWLTLQNQIFIQVCVSSTCPLGKGHESRAGCQLQPIDRFPPILCLQETCMLLLDKIHDRLLLLININFFFCSFETLNPKP